jgi:SepF-like predicted cell division protein (DUF552 family)
LRSLDFFRKSKKEEDPKMEENPALAPNPTSEAPTQQPAVPTETAPAPTETKPSESKTYLKAMPLKDIADLESIKTEVSNGNIIILKITPLANKSIPDVSKAINELYNFVETIGGDIARLGEERIVICPPKIRIWREKTPVQNEPVPTAA